MSTQEEAIANELDRIGGRVASLVGLVHALRDENRTLREVADRGSAENAALQRRLSAARERIEALIERLPEVS